MLHAIKHGFIDLVNIWKLKLIGICYDSEIIYKINTKFCNCTHSTFKIINGVKNLDQVDMMVGVWAETSWSQDGGRLGESFTNLLPGPNWNDN